MNIVFKSKDLSFSGYGVYVEEVCGSRVWNGFIVWKVLCIFLGLFYWEWGIGKMFELRRDFFKFVF